LPAARKMFSVFDSTGTFKATGIAQAMLSLDVDPVPVIPGLCWLMLAENIEHYAKKKREINSFNFYRLLFMGTNGLI